MTKALLIDYHRETDFENKINDLRTMASDLQKGLDELFLAPSVNMKLNDAMKVITKQLKHYRLHCG